MGFYASTNQYQLLYAIAASQTNDEIYCTHVLVRVWKVSDV